MIVNFNYSLLRIFEIHKPVHVIRIPSTFFHQQHVVSDLTKAREGMRNNVVFGKFIFIQ